MRQRPVAVLVIALLSLAEGALWTCCNVMDVGSFPFIVLTGQTGWAQLTSFQWLMCARYLADLGVSVLLVVAGIGLLRGRPWGRTVALVSAVLILLSFLWGVPLSLWEWSANVEPTKQSLAQSGLPATFGNATLAFAYAVQLGLLVLWAALGVTTIFVLRRPHVRDYFSSEAR
jgi:hypothetical protein